MRKHKYNEGIPLSDLIEHYNILSQLTEDYRHAYCDSETNINSKTYKLSEMKDFIGRQIEKHGYTFIGGKCVNDKELEKLEDLLSPKSND